MKRVAAFVDAGYFWVQVCTVLSGGYTSRGKASIDYNALRAIMLDELKAQFAGCDLLRVYWYDGPGNSGKSAEHVAIEKLDDFKLRLGTRNSVGNQKGVDGLIIADLISLTQQKAITHALLVTGDSDIAPGVIAAQGMGLRAHLLSIGPAAATSPYLAAEADFKRSWGTPEVAKFATAVAALTSAVAATPAAASAVPVSSPLASAAVSGAGLAVVASGTVAGMVAVASVVPAPAVVEIDLLEIANKALAHMKRNRNSVAATLATLTKTVPQLPSDVDKALLYSAATQLGRKLGDAEKKELRVKFKALL